MAVTAYWYQQMFVEALSGGVDIPGGTVKAAVVTSAYTPDPATHDFWDDVSANEASADDYPAGGWTLDNAAVTLTGGVVKFDCDDEVVAGPTYPTGRYVVVYLDTGVEGTSRLILFNDLGENTTVGGLTFNASGLGTITVTAPA
jgi:hypothetical protein